MNAAYGVGYDQIEGPAWTEDLHYEIIATLPKGTTREQLQAMLQKLLIERFHLESHRMTKKVQVFSLVIAKNGPKLALSKPGEKVLDETPAPASSGPVKKDKDGYQILRDGVSMAMVSNDGHTMARMQGKDQNMAYLTRVLGGQIRTPVNDETGLTGKYDFTMSWVPQLPGALPDKEEFGPTVFSAVQEQLGLRLVPKKGPVEFFVVDRADKTPTEN